MSSANWCFSALVKLLFPEWISRNKCRESTREDCVAGSTVVRIPLNADDHPARGAVTCDTLRSSAKAPLYQWRVEAGTEVEKGSSRPVYPWDCQNSMIEYGSTSEKSPSQLERTTSHSSHWSETFAREDSSLNCWSRVSEIYPTDQNQNRGRGLLGLSHDREIQLYNSFFPSLLTLSQ